MWGTKTMTKIKLDKIQTTHELLPGNTIITIKTKLFRGNAITTILTELKAPLKLKGEQLKLYREHKYVCFLIILKLRWHM